MFRKQDFIIEPIDRWPGERTKWRKKSQFRSSLDQTYKLLVRELDNLGAKSAVIQAECDRSMIRQDGMLRADARMRGPGVIVSFTTGKGMALSYPCDTYDHFGCNLHAIALALAALRAVDRYGVTRKGEQYTGWQRLPPPSYSVEDEKGQLMSFLKRIVPGTMIYGTLAEAISRAEVLTHPDRGGSPDDFKKVQRARELLLTPKEPP